MIKLKEITKKSWLVLTEDNENVGLLNRGSSNYIFLGKNVKVSFKDEKEICTYFGKNVFEDTVKEQISTQKEYFVKGYPVNYENPQEVNLEELKVDLPLYSKLEGSESYYCAGYYVIYFPKGPVQSFCPRYQTLQEYEYEGPFKTELEMKAILSTAKKKANNGTP